MKKIENTETTEQIAGGNSAPRGPMTIGGTWTEAEQQAIASAAYEVKVVD